MPPKVQTHDVKQTSMSRAAFETTVVSRLLLRYAPRPALPNTGQFSDIQLL